MRRTSLNDAGRHDDLFPSVGAGAPLRKKGDFFHYRQVLWMSLSDIRRTFISRFYPDGKLFFEKKTARSKICGSYPRAGRPPRTEPCPAQAGADKDRTPCRHVRHFVRFRPCPHFFRSSFSAAPSQRSSAASAFAPAASSTYMATAASAAARMPMSSVKPSTGMMSGTTSAGRIR